MNNFNRFNQPSDKQKQNKDTEFSLPADYLKKGYFDEKGNIFPELIVDWAKDIATKLDQSRNPEMKTAQLRKFFGEARRIEGQLKAGKNFESLKSRILKLSGYASDAYKKRNVPELFKQFIEANLKWATKDAKHFQEGFVNHFEMVVAYFPKKQ